MIAGTVIGLQGPIRRRLCVNFLSNFPTVRDNLPTKNLCNQMYGKILILIVEGHKVAYLEYHSPDLQQELNRDCDTDAKLEIQNIHDQEVDLFDSVVN